MDTQTLISDARARFNHSSAKAYLKEKYDSKLIIADQGGLWKVNLETINFLNASLSDTIILIDTFANPVKVNRSDLLTKLQSIYDETMQEWYDEWSELERKR
jgi:hypothetical protein